MRSTEVRTTGNKEAANLETQSHSSGFVAELRKLSRLARQISESSRWEEEAPSAAASKGQLILRRERYEVKSTGTFSPHEDYREYLLVPKEKEAMLKQLLKLKEDEAEGLGLKIVAATRQVLGRAEQYSETYYDETTAKFRYALVIAKQANRKPAKGAVLEFS